jgi:putative chitinase
MSLKHLQTKMGSSADGKIGPNTLKSASNYFKLSAERTAHFFGQVSHETGEFRTFTENLNYSADGLKKIFGKYFPSNLNESYARNPEKIANRVYASRMGNGNEASGDGWKFRGRGALQLTGKTNYQAFSDYLKKPEIMDTPDLVATEFAFESAIFFFDNNKLWTICDKGVNTDTITALTRRVNGGINGLNHRIELTNKYYNWIK